MLEVNKTFLVCAGAGCVNVLGCFQENSPHKFCETTKAGDERRTFGCDKEQFFQCSLEKDMVESGEAIGQIMVLKGSTCRHCPSKDDQEFILSDEEMGPIAFLSSPDDADGETLDSLFDALENIGREERV